ncbi:MAG: DNA primase [Candidatus Alcyoniella australis]|nr:DNA primase [Candidatus Alcyoniella australis]
MAIPEEVIEQLKSRLDIVQVVSEHLTLKKAGRNWRAVCPFHPDKDPSLVVSPERQTFHCFGCGEGGGPIHFVMKITGMSFPEAVRSLAERVGIEVPESNAQSRRRGERDLLLAVNAETEGFFTASLADNGHGKHVREYLAARGISDELVKRFSLGFAPNSWEGLVRHLRSRKADLKRAEVLGLIGVSRRGSLVDKFRNRVMIPIRDVQGRCVGFGGRALGDDEPKYLNSQESELYHKSRVLFGLDTAREAIRQTKRAVVVEGYFDSLALAAHGIGEAVATCGTALTEDHARLLSRYTERIVLLFDGDAAGRKAAWRTMELFLDKPQQPLVVLLPQGHDPDSFVREHGADPLREMLDQAEPILERFIANRVAEAGRSIEAKVHAGQRIGQVLARVEDATRRELLVREAAGRLGVAESAIWQQIQTARNERRKPSAAAVPAAQSERRPTPKEESMLLALATRDPSLLEEIEDAGLIEIVRDRFVGAALQLLLDNRGSSSRQSVEQLLAGLEDQELARELAGAILSELPIDESNLRDAFYDCERRIRLADLRGKARQIAQELAQAKGDPQRERELLQRKQELSRQIGEVDSGVINAFGD